MMTPKTTGLEEPFEKSPNGMDSRAESDERLVADVRATLFASHMPPRIATMSARIVKSGSMTISATSRGTTSMLHRREPQRLERLDLLGHDHRAEFGRDRRAGPARDHDRREHRTELPRRS